MQAVIEISELTKIYKSPRGAGKTAVDHLSFKVLRGEIFGFLGPNGAGKTSTIKMLLGFIRPSYGTASISGTSIDNPAARLKVGYLPEQPYFHKFMTPVEIVSMHAALAGIKRSKRKESVRQVIEIAGLEELSSIPVAKMSKGQVQRVGLAQALIGDPELLILDEPASGLDPLGRRQVRDLLISLKGEGKTIFLSSHLLSEIEAICDTVAVLSHGRLTALGSPDEIKQRGGRVKITTSRLTHNLIEQFGKLNADVSCLEGETVISIDSNHIYDATDILREAKLPLIAVVPERESLEEAFLRLAA